MDWLAKIRWLDHANDHLGVKREKVIAGILGLCTLAILVVGTALFLAGA